MAIMESERERLEPETSIGITMTPEVWNIDLNVMISFL